MMEHLQSAEIARIKGKIQRACTSLLNDAIKFNSKNLEIEYTYSGYVNSLDVDVFIGGFDGSKDGCNRTRLIRTYLVPFSSQIHNIQTWQKILDELTTARNTLQTMKKQQVAA